MPDCTRFPWPPLSAGGPNPTWDGSVFRVGDERLPVLSYNADESSWDAGLTDFHEAAAAHDHPIDVASRASSVRHLAGAVSSKPASILEVGCSSGFLLPMLRKAFPEACIIGSDAFPEALHQLARGGAGFPLLQFDLTRCPLPDSCLDALVMLNVLEHIADEEAALRQVERVLKPRGLAYVEVPAGPWLYDAYDELLHHHRRYSARRLRAAARAAGLDVVWFSHLGFFVFPLFALVKIANRRLRGGPADRKKAEVDRDIRMTRRSGLVAGAFRLEAQVSRFLRLPLGIRCVCLLRKN